MVSAKALCYGDAKSFELAKIGALELPAAIQLFGGEPDTVAKAVGLLEQFGACFIDINMGCPMPKVTKNGDGAALMLDPSRARAVVKAAVRAARIPVSVKMRTGWDEGHINAVDFAKRIEDAGASMITVHGRTRAQLYGGLADWDEIARVKRAVSVPVVGNGDVKRAGDAVRMLAETGCDGVMIGRAARGAPWLPADAEKAVRADVSSGTGRVAHADTRPGAPPPARAEETSGALSKLDLTAVMKRHLELAVAAKGERAGVLETRKHLAWYIKGVQGAAALRNAIFSLTDYGQVLSYIEQLDMTEI